MSGECTRARRLIEIAGYLARREGRVITSDDIGAEFGASRRTVYRDVETLRSMGLAITGEAGTGYSVRRGAVADWLLGLMFRNGRSATGDDIARRIEGGAAHHADPR